MATLRSFARYQRGDTLPFAHYFLEPGQIRIFPNFSSAVKIPNKNVISEPSNYGRLIEKCKSTLGPNLFLSAELWLHRSHKEN